MHQMPADRYTEDPPGSCISRGLAYLAIALFVVFFWIGVIATFRTVL